MDTRLTTERAISLRWITAIAAVSLIAALVAVSWMGFDFSRIAEAAIGDSKDGITFPYHLFQAFDNLLNRPLNLGYARVFASVLEAAPNSYTIAPYGIAVVTLPIYLLSGANHILTANLYVLATFPFTAVAGYALARYLVQAPRPAAAAAGFLLAFAPVRVLHLQLSHPEILSLHALLIALYVLHKLIDSPRWQWAAAFGLSFWYLVTTSAYLGFFLVVYSLIFGVWLLVVQPKVLSLRLIGWSAAAVLVAAVLILPFFSFRLGSVNISGHPFGEIEWLAARPLNWIQGSSFIYFDANGHEVEEKMIFLGFIPLGLAIVGAWLTRRSLRYVSLWVIVIVCAYLFTLGPLIAVGEDSILSPYLILFQLPGAAAIRHTPRYSLLALIGVALLASAALTHLFKTAEPARAWALLCVIAAAFVIESIPYNGLSIGRFEQTFRLASDSPAGYPMIGAPSFFSPLLNDWLDRLPDETLTFHYPVEDFANQQYMAALAYHRQPMLNGQASFYPSWYRDRDWNRFPSLHTLWALREHGVAYILVYNPLLRDDLQRTVTDRLQSFRGEVTWVATVDQVDIYHLEAPASQESIRFDFDEYVPGTGWYGSETRGDGVTFAWTNGSAFTLAFPPLLGDQSATLRARIIFTFQPENFSQLRLEVGGESIPLTMNQTADDRIIDAVLPESVLTREPLILNFTTVQQGSPLLARTGADPRALGLAFDWIEVVSQH